MPCLGGLRDPSVALVSIHVAHHYNDAIWFVKNKWATNIENIYTFPSGNKQKTLVDWKAKYFFFWLPMQRCSCLLVIASKMYTSNASKPFGWYGTPSPCGCCDLWCDKWSPKGVDPQRERMHVNQYILVMYHCLSRCLCTATCLVERRVLIVVVTLFLI